MGHIALFSLFGREKMNGPRTAAYGRNRKPENGSFGANAFSIQQKSANESKLIMGVFGRLPTKYALDPSELDFRGFMKKQPIV